MDDLGVGLAMVLLILLLFALCATLGIAATIGSIAFRLKNRARGKRIPAGKRLALFTVPVLAPALIFMVLFLYEPLLLGVPAAATVAVLVPAALMALGMRDSRCGRPWKAATSLALAGLILLAVPAGFFVYAWSSMSVEQFRSKRAQAALIRQYPSDVIYVPDIAAMPPGTKKGPYLSAGREDGIPQIEMKYHVSVSYMDPSHDAPGHVRSIDLIQRPGAPDLVRRCDTRGAPSCAVVLTTPKGREVRLRLTPPGEMPEDPLANGYYFVALESGDYVEIDMFTNSSDDVRPEDFDLARFVDSLESVPKEEFIKHPPRGTYFGS